MITDFDHFTISFPEGYNDRLESETPSKGYLRDVVVKLEDGSRYKLFFIDPTRLEQDLRSDMANGAAYYAEPGMVILPEVNTETVCKAVAGLWRDNFFRYLKPLP